MTVQPAPALVPLTDDPLLRVALAAHLGRYRGASRMHTESDLHVYLRLVRRTRHRTARGPTGRCRTVRALAAGGPSVQAVDRVASLVGGGRVLPDLRYRRGPGPLARRVRAPAQRPARI